MQRHRYALALLAATVPLALAPGATGEESTCIADWSVAAPIVEKEGLVKIERLYPLVHAKLGVKIVKATLCSEGGSYVFQLVVRAADGPLRRITVDATAPFEP